MNMKTPACAALSIIVASLLSACTLMQRPVDTSLSPATQLLFYSRALVRAPRQGRLAMLETAKNIYADAPTPANGARLALAYGQPDYKGYAPDQAAQHANKALAEGGDYWGAAASAFLAHFAALTADNSSTRKQLRQAQAHNDDLKQQLAALRQALADAQDKLNALTRIETELNQ